MGVEFDPNKKYFPSRSGKKGYIRICQRCGKVLYRVGKTAKWCFDCRAEVRREQKQKRYAENKRSDAE